MPLNKDYLYKIYKPDGTYLGLLDDVVSPFGYNQNTETIGAQIQVVTQKSTDTASLPNSPVLDETGEAVLDETGEAVLDDGLGSVVGDGNSNNLVQNNNLIKVYEVSDYNPSGKIVFDGYISKWKTSSGTTEDITLTCLNLGQDFAQIVLPGGNALVLDQSQTSQNDNFSFNSTNTTYMGQVITVGSVPNLAAVAMMFASLDGSTQTASVYVFASPTDAYNGVTPLAVVTNTITNSTPTEYLFKLPASLASTPGQNFFIASDVTNSHAPQLRTYFYDSKVYSGGDLYLVGVGTGITLDNTQDMYFKTYYSQQNTERLYKNRDVAYILNDCMSVYTGAVSYTPIADTGVVIPTYTFKANTYLEMIQAVAQMGAANYFWYIDVATNTLHYQQASLTADLTFIEGRHLNSVEIEATKEPIINVVYYTGGDDGSGRNTNAFVLVTDPASLVTNRVGSVHLTNSNVVGTTAYETLKILAQNYIDQHSSEAYIATIVVQDGTFDLSTISLGLMSGYAGFGNFTDSLLLQIVGLSITPDQATLQVGTLPIRSSKVVEQIASQLSSTQTVANPDIPN